MSQRIQKESRCNIGPPVKVQKEFLDRTNTLITQTNQSRPWICHYPEISDMAFVKGVVPIVLFLGIEFGGSIGTVKDY